LSLVKRLLCLVKLEYNWQGKIHTCPIKFLISGVYCTLLYSKPSSEQGLKLYLQSTIGDYADDNRKTALVNKLDGEGEVGRQAHQLPQTFQLL
jgi:hypothetical protein